MAASFATAAIYFGDHHVEPWGGAWGSRGTSSLTLSLVTCVLLAVLALPTLFGLPHGAALLPVHAIVRLRAEGVGIGRSQISYALRVFLSPETTRAALQDQLAPLFDRVYLHQVVEQQENGQITRFPDLEEALASWQVGTQAEWRIQFTYLFH